MVAKQQAVNFFILHLHDYKKHFTKMPKRPMKKKTKPKKHPKKENENPPEILSAKLNEIKEELMAKCFEVG